MVALYAIMLVIVMAALGFLPQAFKGDSFQFVTGVDNRFFYWGWFVWWLVCQAVLLLIPVRVVSRRPVTRRSWWGPLVMTGVLTLVLLTCAFFILAVVFSDLLKVNGDYWPWLGLGLFLAIWVGWAVVFFGRSRRVQNGDRKSGLLQWLLTGSILELLVAVPTHIWVRESDDCCAGIFTLFGLVMGIPIMLLCFGPGVFYLFVERAKRLRPRVDESGAQ
ncbi:MAG: hypothetical protein QM796_01765 [Chthoniobacteraceae bacterium]